MTKRYPYLNLKTILLSLLVCGIFGLVLYNVHDSIFGTRLDVATATDGSTLDSTFLPISGSAPHARSITVNGRAIAVDKAGHFDDGVILSMGYNIVEVSVLDRFGKEKTRTYSLVVEPSGTIARADTTTYQP